MANKLIAALRNAHLEGIKEVSISSLSARTEILAPEIDMPGTWGVKSWGELQRLHNIYRKGKGKSVKFYELTVENLLNAEESHLPSNVQGNGKQEASTPALVVSDSNPESSNYSYLPTSTLVEETDNLLAELETAYAQSPIVQQITPVAHTDEDDDIPEENAESLVSQEAAIFKPSWNLLFGELEKRNPLYARIAAIAVCYYHPSYDFQEYFDLISLIREGFDSINSDREKLSKISKQLAQWEPSDKFGLLLLGIASFNCPRYLLKNPNAGFSNGGYTFTDGERPTKLPMFLATGKTGSGKSEIIKLLAMVSDGTFSVSTTSASVAMKISQIKDNRLAAQEYSLGWRGLPLEHYDLRTQQHTNLVCLIPDLSRRGTDFPKLEEALKSSCEQDKNIERQSGSLDGNNKTFLLSGANIAISSCYELSDDPNHPISELIRRSVVFGCYGLDDENAQKIKHLLLSPEDLDWNGFNLSHLWQKEYSKLASGNQVNKLVAAKDGKTKQMIYPIQAAEKEVRQWEITEKMRSGSLDFIASLLGFALVCYVRRNKFISREYLIKCTKYYLENNKVVLNNQNTSSEFVEQFREVLNAAVGKLSKSAGKENYAISEGIPALLIQKHYTNTQKRLLASKKDIPSLTELMSHLGYEARLKDSNGCFYQDFNGEYETRYFLTEDTTLKV